MTLTGYVQQILLSTESTLYSQGHIEVKFNVSSSNGFCVAFCIFKWTPLNSLFRSFGGPDKEKAFYS